MMGGKTSTNGEINCKRSPEILDGEMHMTSLTSN